MSEQWLPVVGWEGTHEVSDTRRVRSLPRVRLYRDGRRRAYPGCELRPCMGDGAGHRIITLSMPKQRRYVHHLVLEAFVGPRLPGAEACHGPVGPADNRLVNLRWGTRSSNGRDKRRDGTDYQVAKQRCPREHLLRRPNLVAWVDQRGQRACLACARARAYLQQHPDADLRVTSDRYYAALAVTAAILAGGHR